MLLCRFPALVCTLILATFSLFACAEQAIEGEKSTDTIKNAPFELATPGFSRLEFPRPANGARVRCGGSPKSPIVVNVDGELFKFSDDYNTVAFDMDANGIKENLGWTLKGSNIAFLAMDRNDNGSIDNGSELFSSVSPQPESLCPNGYLALKVLDTDSDGRLTPSDELFSHLLLWTDSNHNGVSEKTELISVGKQLRAIDLHYVRSDRVDDAGNFLSLFGTAETNKREKIYIVDVRFLELFRAEASLGQ